MVILIKRIFVCLVFMCALVQVYAQEMEYFVVTGRITTDDGRVDGATITILKNGTETEVITPPRTGRFRFEFEYNNEYELSFQKDGFFKKIIVISSHVPQSVMDRNSEFPPFSFIVNLFKELPGIDKSFTNKPVGRVFYNPEIDNFDSEIYFSDIQIEEQIEEAKNQNSELTAEQREINRANRQDKELRESNYDKAIKDANNFYKQQNLEAALERFKYAGELFPDRPYPKDRIAELQDLIAAQKLAQQQAQQQFAKYQEMVDQADQLFNTREFERAKEVYQNALGFKPGDQYAISQISKADERLGQQQTIAEYEKLVADADQLFANGNLQQARDKYLQAANLGTAQQEYPQKQIAQIDEALKRQAEIAELEKQFQQAMSNGDAAFQAEDYRKAETAFQTALNLKQDDPQAKQRLAQVEEILRQQEIQTNYEQRIADADKAFDEGNLALAKSLYQQAADFIPTETYPSEQIAKIDQQTKTEADFEMLMNLADESFRAGNWEQARDLYTEAKQLKAEPKIDERIQEIDGLIAQKELDDKYDGAIIRADNLFISGKYDEAKIAYQEAASIKSDEPYPKDQLVKIDQELARLADVAEKEAAYQAAMEAGNQAFTSEQYQEAIGAYQRALESKANDPLAQGKITEVQQILAIQESRSRYNGQIASADEAYNNENWESARNFYQEAASTLPEESYPKDRINQIDQILETNSHFDEFVSQAEQAYSAENYEQAKDLYQQAYDLKAAADVQQKINEIEALLKQQEEERIREQERLAAIEKAYQDAINRGNSLLAENKFEEARAAYQEAKQAKPTETLPDDLIQQANNRQAQYEQQLAEEKAREEAEAAYQSVIQSGDSLFALNELEDSKAAYAKASEMKPTESYPRSKMREIDAMLNKLAEEEARQQAIDASYQEAVQMGDQALAQNDYPTAQSNYSEASRIKPDESYPKDQLAKIEQLIQQEIETNYSEAIARGDRLFGEENYADAKQAYTDALGIKSGDEYATAQNAKIDQLLQQLAQEQQAKEELERSYQDKMQLANTAFRNSQFENAKSIYQEAISLKPDESLPGEQIARIDSLLAEQQRQQEINQQYSTAMKNAQAAYSQNELQQAITLYNEALTYKPNEPLPKQRIEEINTLIAQQEEIDRLAKQEEEQRLARMKARQDKYDAAIASADEAFNSEQFGQAREFYTQALNAKPEEQYPKNQIAEIDRMIEEQAMAEMKQKQQAYQDSLRKAQEEAYQLKLTQAQEHLTNREYENAIADYQSAIQILPENRDEISGKIEEAREEISKRKEQKAGYDDAIARADQFFQNGDLENALNAYDEASQYMPDQNYPKERARAIRAEISTTNEKYNAAIASADQYFETQDWINAKDKYTEALGIKKDETYPSERLAVVNQKIRELQEAQKARQMTDESYKEAIASGEQALQNGELSAARMHFEFAKELKPDEAYPDQKMDEIDELISKQKQEEELTRQQAMVDDQYRQMISQADNSFKAENYAVAKTQYNVAASIKPEEKYPQNQIAIINKLLEEKGNIASSANVPENPTVSPVSRPNNPVTTEKSDVATNYVPRSTTSDYDNNIRLGDQAYRQRDYTVAQFYYYKALKDQPNSTYANSRIDEIEKLIDQTMKASELTAYNEAITRADNEFLKKNYSIARFYYYKGLEIKSWEQYPKDKIEEIRALTNSMLSQREEEAYRDLISRADEAYYRKELSVARSYYNQALGIKKDERYPQIKLKDIDKLVEQELRNEENQKYLNTLAEADKAMYAKNYSIARFYYNKALGIKPKEKYPREQLQKIKELITANNN